MKKIKIGVKFCGGCQSRYERGKLYELVRTEITDVDFEYANDNYVYDILLVISGCPIKCADITRYKANITIHIDSENYKNAVKLIKENIHFK